MVHKLMNAMLLILTKIRDGLCTSVVVLATRPGKFASMYFRNVT
jgi:hypothetical protein